MHILSNYIVTVPGGIIMAQKMTSYFNDFLKEIRLTENQVSELKQAHKTLRNRLLSDDDVSKYI